MKPQLFAEPPSEYQLTESWVVKQTFSLNNLLGNLLTSEKNQTVNYWDG